MDVFVNFLFSYWHLCLVGFFILVIVFCFVFRFAIPAWRLKWKFNNSIQSLEKLKNGTNGIVTDLDKIKSALSYTPELVNCWKEYSKTLHDAESKVVDGQKVVSRWRASALAETFFSDVVIFDTPLKADFYKHIPGVLTGLGIIGTFLGLIFGLSSFDISDPSMAQLQLKALVNAVGHAFYCSCAAIIFAMLFTWIEKSLVSGRHRQIAKIREKIDNFFNADLDEKYLERLVNATEAQATQSQQIKDSLVTDLKDMLNQLAERQIKAQAEQTLQLVQAQNARSGRLSEDIGKAISEKMGGPMAEIAQAVKRVGADQGDAVQTLLADVLKEFTARMEDMFGGQMHGMADLLQQTTASMQQTADRFSALASNMDSAGQNAAEAMAEKLNVAISAMEERQQTMNQQTATFVEQIRGVVADSQSASAQKLQESLGQLSTQVSDVVADLRKQADIAAVAQGQQLAHFEEATGNTVAGLSEQVKSLLSQSAETNQALQHTVTDLSKSVAGAVSGMSDGAGRLHSAAMEFAKAGLEVSKTMKAAAEATGQIQVASNTLSTSTSAARNVLADYSKISGVLASMVEQLKSVTEDVKRDAAMNSEFVSRIEAATDTLGEAQLQAKEYLDGINKVLVEAHESFSTQVTKSLREGNRQFQGELRQAVDMVSAAVRDLGDTLEDLPGRDAA